MFAYASNARMEPNYMYNANCQKNFFSRDRLYSLLYRINDHHVPQQRNQNVFYSYVCVVAELDRLVAFFLLICLLWAWIMIIPIWKFRVQTKERKPCTNHVAFPYKTCIQPEIRFKSLKSLFFTLCKTHLKHWINNSERIQ